MKKFSKVFCSLAAVLVMMAPLSTSANALNENESKIIAELEAGVTVNGTVVNLPAQQKYDAQKYFSTPGVDVSDAQYNVISTQILAGKNYVVSNNIQDLLSVTAKQGQDLIDIATPAANILGLTISFDAISRTIMVLDADGNILSMLEVPIKDTGSMLSTTILMGGMLLAMAAAFGLFAKKKGYFVR